MGNTMLRWNVRTFAATAVLVVCAQLLGTGVALACTALPGLLARPHAEVVAEASQIYWAEVLSAQVPAQVGKATLYRFRVLRSLKGQVDPMVTLSGASGEGEGPEIWDITFDDHAADVFWRGAMARMGIEGDCSLSPPHFKVGRRYLLLLGGRPDTKQFERVDIESDRWLAFVQSELAARKPSKTPGSLAPAMPAGRRPAP
jgi:hypothetical protein